MANSITQQKFSSIRRYVYVIGLLVIVIGAIVYGLSLGGNVWIDKSTIQRQAQLTLVEQKVKQLGSERSFFSYAFAKNITKNGGIKWSEHIKSLIDVLNQIQTNSSIGANAVILSDFTITPETISLKGKVKDLILLYYSSSEKNYTSVIDRFTNLPFISNISIKNYNKVGDYYEFVLNADINLNVTIQPKSINTGNAITANMNTGYISGSITMTGN